MKISKIYLETTMFNYYFDDERDAHVDTVNLFIKIKAGKYEAYTSGAVIEELEKAPVDKHTKMINLINEYKINVLSVSEEAEKLADDYVSVGIIPLKYRTDGVHIAVTAVNDLDIIVSMNFEHIVKMKTKKLTNALNIVRGYKNIDIVSPMEVD